MRKPAFTISVTSRRHAWNLVWSEALSRKELEDEMGLLSSHILPS